jgi:signal transduction histidine kinase
MEKSNKTKSLKSLESLKTLERVCKICINLNHQNLALILENKKFEELTNQFIQNIQHDIRTPWSGIQQIFEHFSTNADKISTEELKEISEMGNEAIKTLTKFINSILDFDSEYSKKEIKTKPLCLYEMVRNLSSVYKLLAKKNNIEFCVNIDHINLPYLLFSDKYRVEKILVNVLSNAFKFIKKTKETKEIKEKKINKISLNVNNIFENDKKILVRFCIKDTGIGIPLDKREVIFEKFCKLHPSNKGLYDGAGVGLALVKKYINDLKGNLHPVKSSSDEGTIFSFDIPFYLTD